jgi:hypothetical protein
MNHSVFIQVIDRFNTGQVIFNRGRNWSFLFDQKWYPVHAFMAEYNSLMGIPGQMNLHSSVFELSKFFPTATAEIEYLNHLPVPVNQ